MGRTLPMWNTIKIKFYKTYFMKVKNSLCNPEEFYQKLQKKKVFQQICERRCINLLVFGKMCLFLTSWQNYSFFFLQICQQNVKTVNFFKFWYQRQYEKIIVLFSKFKKVDIFVNLLTILSICRSFSFLCRLYLKKIVKSLLRILHCKKIAW